jgi:glycolate oxidase iron-sulfur subunit
METKLLPSVAATPEGKEAESILRACVHCGFCTATCPTYQLLGDELDGPRGRIYLIKQALEGAEVTAKTQLHLDRCLTCRACETTCPSGVRYGRLVDIGRKFVDDRVGRSAMDAARRGALRRGLLSRPLFGAALGLGRFAKGWLPRRLASSIPDVRGAGAWPAPRHPRRVLIPAGCVQPSLAPNIDAATARVLDRAGVSALAVDDGGCCGALSYHLSEHDEARAFARRNIDAWWPHVDQGAEAIVVTASGCGVMVREYDHLLAGDPAYAARARRVSDLARDPVELIADAWAGVAPHIDRERTGARVAFHPPCTLQHGIGIRGAVERLLADAGFTLLPVADAHLCCGSAGTYNILQPALAEQLRARKVANIESLAPDVIAAGNIGCITQLAAGSAIPVVHTIELLDWATGGPMPEALAAVASSTAPAA